MKVLCRGVIYPDVPTAALALKVAKATVYCAMSRGNLEKCGLGAGTHDHNKVPHTSMIKLKPVVVAGKRFASMAEVARFIGRNPRSVRVSVQAGLLAQERLALAVMKAIAAHDMTAFKNMLKDDNSLPSGHKEQAVLTAVNGVVYPTQKAAATALGVSTYALRKAIDNGSENDLHATPKRRGKNRVSTPIRVHGILYPSVKQAASALNLAVNTIYKARRDNRLHSVGAGIGHSNSR